MDDPDQDDGDRDDEQDVDEAAAPFALLVRTKPETIVAFRNEKGVEPPSRPAIRAGRRGRRQRQRERRSHHGNLVVYGPGGYRFADFARVGAPLTAVIAVTVAFLAPLIWR